MLQYCNFHKANTSAEKIYSRYDVPLSLYAFSEKNKNIRKGHVSTYMPHSKIFSALSVMNIGRGHVLIYETVLRNFSSALMKNFSLFRCVLILLAGKKIVQVCIRQIFQWAQFEVTHRRKAYKSSLACVKSLFCR